MENNSMKELVKYIIDKQIKDYISGNVSKNKNTLENTDLKIFEEESLKRYNEAVNRQAAIKNTIYSGTKKQNITAKTTSTVSVK